MSRVSETDPLYATLQSTTRFVWNHLTSVICISLGWFLACLPLVMIGPATVGAYSAVLSLHDDGYIDYTAVLSTVRQQFIHAVLLGLIPLLLLAAAATSGFTFLVTGAPLPGLVALVGLYAAAFTWLVSVPTFVGLADEKSAVDALTSGYLWTIQHIVGAVVLGIVTAALFVISSLLTVAVALLFAGVAFAFHVEFVTGIAEAESIRHRPTDHDSKRTLNRRTDYQRRTATGSAKRNNRDQRNNRTENTP